MSRPSDIKAFINFCFSVGCFLISIGLVACFGWGGLLVGLGLSGICVGLAVTIRPELF